MHNRFFVSSILLFALFVGTCGNVFAAAFCPRFAVHKMCCHVQQARESCAEHYRMTSIEMGDAEMPDMQMSDMQMPDMQMPDTQMPDMQSSDLQLLDAQTACIQMVQAMNQVAGSNVIAQPDAPCTHCIGHGQLLLAASVLREADQTRNGEHVATPLADVDTVSLARSFVIRIHSKQHSPPGDMTSRQILFNSFRI